MEINKKAIPEYTLPYKQHSRLKFYLHLMYILLMAIFLIPFFLHLDNDKESLILKAFFLLFFTLFLTIWLYTGVFRKPYIELNEQGINIKTIFKLRMIKWNEIYTIDIYKQGNNTMFGIILKEKIKKRKDTVFTFLNDLFGGSYSAAFALSIYPDFDIERLYLTITNKIAEASKHSVDYYESKENSNEELKRKNFFFSFLICFGTSIILGILYGVSIFLFKVNFIFIPIINYLIILYFYNKNYKEIKINIFYRILIGIICTLQVFIGILSAIYLESKIPFSYKNIIEVVTAYFTYLKEEPSKQGYTLIIAVFILFSGTLQGYKFKFQKRMSKLTMKKKGNYYYKKEGKLITIYLIDPVGFNDQFTEKLSTTIWEDCLIELSKKTVQAFYIPQAIVNQLEINMRWNIIEELEGKPFYKIDLGSTGKYRNYVFPCVIICDKDKNVEVIQLQIK